MGLFEDIDRAWFTVDRKLFLWNYNDGYVPGPLRVYM
jgi:nuclear pore complex protein Nup155